MARNGAGNGNPDTLGRSGREKREKRRENGRKRGQTTNLANGTNGGLKTGEKLRNAPKTRKWGWKTGKKCILGRFWAARGLRRGFMAGKQEIFMKTGGDGGLIVFSCMFPVFLLSRWFWGSGGRLAGPEEACGGKKCRKRLATGLGGLKTGVFSRKTGSLQENRRGDPYSCLAGFLAFLDLL